MTLTAAEKELMRRSGPGEVQECLEKKCPECGAGGLGSVVHANGDEWFGCQDCPWERFVVAGSVHEEET